MTKDVLMKYIFHEIDEVFTGSLMPTTDKSSCLDFVFRTIMQELQSHKCCDANMIVRLGVARYRMDASAIFSKYEDHEILIKESFKVKDRVIEKYKKRMVGLLLGVGRTIDNPIIMLGVLEAYKILNAVKGNTTGPLAYPVLKEERCPKNVVKRFKRAYYDTAYFDASDKLSSIRKSSEVAIATPKDMMEVINRCLNNTRTSYLAKAAIINAIPFYGSKINYSKTSDCHPMFGNSITDRDNLIVITKFRCDEYIKSIYCDLLRLDADSISSHNSDKNLLDNRFSIIGSEKNGEIVYFSLVYSEKEKRGD